MFPSPSILEHYVEFEYSYYNYVGEITWCEIFWWFYRSPGSLSNHAPYFFKQAWLPFCGLNYNPLILGVLGINHSCTCHSFLIGWLPFYFWCNNTCWNRHFPIPNGTTRCPSHVTLGCLLSCLTF